MSFMDWELLPPNQERRSTCCNADIYAEGLSTTMYWVCMKCGNPCDAKVADISSK